MKVLFNRLGGGSQYVMLFQDFGFEETRILEEADIVCFQGGSDVTPSLYDEARHPTTYFCRADDKEDACLYNKARRLGKPLVGICRGAQFLNVMNGGKLYQDVNNHAVGQTHEALDLTTGERLAVTSTHHQMMRPSRKGQVFLIAEGLATRKEHMVNGVITSGSYDGCDVEGVFYPKGKSLCIQGHPEHMAYGAQFREYFFKQVNKYLGVLCAE